MFKRQIIRLHTLIFFLKLKHYHSEEDKCVCYCIGCMAWTSATRICHIVCWYNI